MGYWRSIKFVTLLAVAYAEGNFYILNVQITKFYSYTLYTKKILHGKKIRFLKWQANYDWG